MLLLHQDRHNSSADRPHCARCAPFRAVSMAAIDHIRRNAMLANTLKHSLIALAIAATYCHAQTVDLNGGYLTSGDGTPVRSAYGDCWRTAAWTGDRTSQECDSQLAVKETPKLPLMPAPTAPKRLSFATEVLFDFEQAELDADGRKQLDELAQQLLAIDVEKVDGTAPS